MGKTSGIHRLLRMNTYNKKNKIILSVVISVLILALTAGAVLAYILYRNELEENEHLRQRTELLKTELEEVLQREEERLAAEAEEEEAQRAEYETRSALQAEFLSRSREELLSLVNPWNAIDPDYEPHLTDIGDGMMIDERCAAALKAMLADCKKSGHVPCPISAYRTEEYQQELFDNKVMRVIAGGTPADRAEEEAAQSVAVPGTSEHQLGLAIDIVDQYYPDLDNYQEWTETQQWLIKHSWEYGFILRYPSGTSEKTGILFEPWHYRYVGKTTAAQIHGLGITFEEYCENYL